MATSQPQSAPTIRSSWIHWRPTVIGQLLLGIIILMLLVGIVKNINLLALLGYVLLGIIGLSSIVAGRRTQYLRARRILDETLFSQTAIHLEVRVHNESSRDVLGVRIEDKGASHQAVWFFERIEGQSRHGMTAEILLPRRGWYDFPPLLARSTAPFGLWQRTRNIGPAQRVLLLPRPGKLLRDRLRQQLRGADPSGERVHRHLWRHESAQADFHGLRPFRTGDSPRWIHWRTSARRGELMVREFEDVPGDDLVLVLDVPRAAEPLETLIQLAATIVWDWNQRRGDRFVLIVPGEPPLVLDGVTSFEHARTLLECLATLQPRDGCGQNLTIPPGSLPSTASVVVLTIDTSPMVEELEQKWHRPVLQLTPQGLMESGVYVPP